LLLPQPRCSTLTSHASSTSCAAISERGRHRPPCKHAGNGPRPCAIGHPVSVKEGGESSTSKPATPVRYRSKPVFVWTVVVWCAVITCGASIVAIAAAVDGQWAWLVPWAVALGWVWYCLLFRFSFEARLWPDEGRLEFRSLLHARQTR